MPEIALPVRVVPYADNDGSEDDEFFVADSADSTVAEYKPKRVADAISVALNDHAALQAQVATLTAERDEARRQRDQWHALADERSQDVVNDAVLITSLKRDLGLLAADRDEWHEAVMLCLAGVVGTPERGYVEDGGPKRAQGDARAARAIRPADGGGAAEGVQP